MTDCNKCENLKKRNENLKEKIENLFKKIAKIEQKFTLCWLCGNNELTNHHFETKRKRKRGLGTIPLCPNCHEEVENIKKAIGLCDKKNMTFRLFKIQLDKIKELKMRKNLE